MPNSTFQAMAAVQQALGKDPQMYASESETSSDNSSSEEYKDKMGDDCYAGKAQPQMNFNCEKADALEASVSQSMNSQRMGGIYASTMSLKKYVTPSEYLELTVNPGEALRPVGAQTGHFMCH